MSNYFIKFLSSEYGMSSFLNPHGLFEAKIFHSFEYGSTLNSSFNDSKSIVGKTVNGSIV